MKVQKIGLLAMMLILYITPSGNLKETKKIEPTDIYFKKDARRAFESNSGYCDMNTLFYPKIQNGQAYLYNRKSDTVVFGPCRYIYYEDLNNKVFRFVDQNGLIGYASIMQDRTVSILHNGQYSEATAMQDGSACVKDGEFYYYIDKNGIRFTKHDYVEAYPFSESQGFFARVKMEDGHWAIIDKKENVIFDSFDSIEKLPYLTTYGAATRNDKVVLFSLEQFEDDSQPRITAILDYIDIHILGRDCLYAIVTSKDGKKGVITIWNGEVFIPTEYVDIQFGDIDNTETFFFRCQKEDTTVDYFYTKGIW